MAITYHICIDHDDDGNFDAPGEDITGDVLAVRWRLGMARTFDSIAAPTTATITLDNRAGTYSPERHTLLPGKTIIIESDDGSTRRRHLTGVVHHITPTAGDQGEKTAVIDVRGIDHWLRDATLQLAPLVDVRADAIIQAILEQVAVRRPALADRLLIGVSGYAALDSQSLSGSAWTTHLEAGISLFAYAGDTWTDGIDAADALAMVAVSERGRFFLNRAGEAVFYNRHHTLIQTAVDATFSDDMHDLRYDYGSALLNRVQIGLMPRATGAANTPLWSLASPQKMAPGANQRITCRYQDTDQKPVGAVTVNQMLPYTHYHANTRSDGSGEDATPWLRLRQVATGFSTSDLEIVNDSHRTVYLRHLTLTGTPLIQGDALLLTEDDATSRTLYGPGTLSLTLPLLSSLDEAANLARYELARHRQPRGRLHSLTLSARTQPQAVLSRTLFDRIRVTESQTGHSADYVIIAEAHEVTAGGRDHRVIWTLEPADDAVFVVLDAAKPDGSRVLAY